MKLDYKLGLVVHAIGLPDEKRRLLASIRNYMDRDWLDVALIDEDMEDRAKVNVAAAKNKGIRKCLADNCDGIVCVDVDYLIPPGLFELCMASEIQPHHLWVRRRDIQPGQVNEYRWRDWLKLPIFGAEFKGTMECRGSCNFMSRENWLKVGGWDERAGVGWGGDDDVLHQRIRQAGIETRVVDALPLVHVSHDIRPWGGVNARGQQNWQWHKEPQPNYLA